MAELPRGVLDRPALLLHKLGMEVLLRAEDPLAALGLSGRQYFTLAILSDDAPASQQELARLCGLLPAQVVGVLDELERRGLAERQRDDADRRRSVVRITAAGSELLGRADALGRTIEDALFSDLDPATRESFTDAMRAALGRARDI